MPHKHTRRDKDLSSYDLPPSQIAAPLPVVAPSRKKGPATKNKTANAQAGIKRKRGSEQKDDAPRAFKRLMAFADGKRIKSGLDDGNRRTGKNKKKKKEEEGDPENAKAAETTASTVEKPTIKPGERMSDFAARVDAALPLGGLITKTVRNGKDPLGLKVYRTKKERKMHKLYDEWREEDRKIKEQREEEQAEAEERELENDELGVSWRVNLQGASTGKKSGKKGKHRDDDDPWEELKRKRGETKIGLNDTVQAPPRLPRMMPKNLFSRGETSETGSSSQVARGGGGGGRRQEELEKARVKVLAAYSRMKGKKNSEARYHELGA